MSREYFKISRLDGRSNQQVIIDLVHNDSPGTVYPYQHLIEVLNTGSERTFERDQVRNVVIQANRRLLKEFQRVLHNVKNHGYRLAEANQHNPLALVRKRRADNQMKRGVELLRNVRWDELTPTQRSIHEAHLVLIGGLYEQQQAANRRIQRIEDVLKKNKIF